jgi:hypothetical protein
MTEVSYLTSSSQAAPTSFDTAVQIKHRLCQTVLLLIKFSWVTSCVILEQKFIVSETFCLHCCSWSLKKILSLSHHESFKSYMILLFTYLYYRKPYNMAKIMWGSVLLIRSSKWFWRNEIRVLTSTMINSFVKCIMYANVKCVLLLQIATVCFSSRHGKFLL